MSLKDFLRGRPPPNHKEARRIALLNRPRYIHTFKFLEEKHCGMPLILFKLSGQGPDIVFCAKCRLMIEEPIER